MTKASSPRRMAGIRFVTEPQAVSDTLPRMDIAVFVGFAASGPLHTPVAVEDAAQFSAIFGPELQLETAPQHGESRCGYLGPTVRSFFANGGRRCWIVRVADEKTASCNFYPVSGLLQARNGELRPAFAKARSEGSWSDPLRLGALLLVQELKVKTAKLKSADPLELELDYPGKLSPGDMLRLSFEKEGLLVIFPVQSVTKPAEKGNLVTVRSDTAKWFAPSLPVTSPPGPVQAHAFTPVAGEEPIRLGVSEIRNGSRPGLLTLTSLQPHESLPKGVASGTVLRLQSGAAKGWMTVRSAAVTSGPGSPPSPGFEVRGEALWVADAPGKDRLPVSEPVLERVSFELSVWQGNELAARLPDLGFCAGHPRFWGAVPDDRVLYAEKPSGYEQLMREISIARFPLSCDIPTPSDTSPPFAPPRSSDRREDTVYFPIGMPAGRDAALLAPVASPGSPLSRDGLQKPTAAIFLDRDLKASSSETLMATADFLRYQQAHPRPILKGIHAALNVEEASIVAVPDAVYCGWSEVAKEASGKTAPPPTDPAPEPERTFGDCAAPKAAPKVSPAPLPAPGKLQRAFLPEEFVAVQRALIRMCAARGDLVAVLNLPQHFREDDAIAQVGSLISAERSELQAATGVAPLGSSEAFALSYAAMFHPWLVSPRKDAAGDFAPLPPDGAICGMVAQRALSRGAWVAPANEVLKEVIALTPSLREERRQSFQDARMNLVIREPRGFTTLSSYTLSDDPDLRLINVRRLLILIRKQALQKGAQYVFEPNHPPFRRMVQRGFEAMLDEMFQRGAFSGASAASAYQVDTGSSLNTAQSIEQGRFIVQLKVAPSHPMTFLTIRLVQTGDRLSLLEGP